MSHPILLDHAASTPPRHEAIAAMVAALHASGGGNPSAGHAFGRRSRTMLEEARERLASSLGRSPHEVVLTSGGTEADQLAVVGTYLAARDDGRGQHIVCSAVEHPAVRDAVRWLESTERATVTWVAPVGTGPLELGAVVDVVRDDTVLVCLTGADGEVGVVQPSSALAAWCDDRGVALHTDAVQRLATHELPATGSLAVSGHKLGAPVGIGLAALPRGTAVQPLVPGPGQERGVRSGTPPAALAVALAAAVELAVAERAAHADRCRLLTARLAAGLAEVDGLAPTVAPDDADRLATHLHLQVDGTDPEALAMALDDAGVATSPGTACATGTAAPSHVLAAYGIAADAAVRCSVGRTTTEDDVDAAAERISHAVTTLRDHGGGFL